MINRVAKNRTTERRKKTYVNPCHNLDDVYKFYCELVKDKEDKYKVTVQQFKNICHLYNKKLSTAIVDEAEVVKLPYRLGRFSIKKCKMTFKKLRLDHGHFKKTGEKKYHLNLHSNDWVAKWHWSKKSCVVLNKSKYSFTTVDTNKKAINKVMSTKGGHTRYYEI